MKQITTQAILLRRMNYGEADRILTVITSDSGKVGLLAKGVRKSKSKLAGGLELFSTTNITFIDGRSDLKIVTSAQLIDYYREISKNIDITMVGYDFLKYVDAYTEEESGGEFYQLLIEALGSLNEPGTPTGHTAVWFYVHLLLNSGYGLQLDTDLSGNAFSEESLYDFSYEDMSFFVHKTGSYTPRHIKLLRLLTKVGSPAHLLKVQDADIIIDDLIVLLKNAVRY